MVKLKLTLIALFTFTHLGFGQRTEKVFLNPKDSTANCYTVYYPPQLPWTGYVVLLPGFGESAEDVLQQTDLPQIMAQKGFLTIIPTLQDGVLSLGVDPASQQCLEQIIANVRSKHKLQDQKFFIGGFSIGGSCAITYAQNSTKKPQAVFAIDPPLDFERFYNSCIRNQRLSIIHKPSQECLYLLDRIAKEFGGTPQTALEKYHSISPYSFSDTQQTAVKKFGSIPLRIYSEPDIHWWLQERQTDITSMNIVDASAFINELRRLGNTDATLVVTENKGYRKPNNQRHPHSWSIVDPEALISWVKQQ